MNQLVIRQRLALGAMAAMCVATIGLGGPAGAQAASATATQTGIVAGRLVDAADAPVANSEVRLFSVTTGQKYIGGLTGADGRYETIGVPAGRYRMKFALPGNPSAAQYVPQALRYRDAAIIEVSAANTLTVDERLLPTGTIKGAIVTPDGLPLTGESVAIRSADLGPADGAEVSAALTTNAAGEFRTEMFAGRYRVQFFVQATQRNQFFAHAVTAETATVFTVTGGQELSITDQLLPTGQVRLTARNEATGEPIASFCAQFQNIIGCSDGTGIAVMSGVPATPLDVRYTAYEGRYESGSVRVEAVGGGTIDVVLNVRPIAG